MRLGLEPDLNVTHATIPPRNQVNLWGKERNRASALQDIGIPRNLTSIAASETIPFHQLASNSSRYRIDLSVDQAISGLLRGIMYKIQPDYQF